MKSLMLLTIFLNLFLYSLSTLCIAITSDMATKENCLKGQTILANTTCCYEVTTYKNKVQKACFPYIKNITYIKQEIRAKMAANLDIEKINVDCSSFYLQTSLFILLLLFLGL